MNSETNALSTTTDEPGPARQLRAVPERRGNLQRRQVAHDIRHELSTIMLLASVIKKSRDAGAESRDRAEQILTETRWLEELIIAYERDAEDAHRADRAAETRLDLVATDTLRPLRMSSRAMITLEAQPVSAAVDRLVFWRVLRNIIGNALKAAGDGGRVAVRVYVDDGDATVEVDDDGPGFDPEGATGGSLGLTIVTDLVQNVGGDLTIGQGSLGGCGVRLHLGPAGPA